MSNEEYKDLVGEIVAVMYESGDDWGPDTLQEIDRLVRAYCARSYSCSGVDE